MELLRKGKFEVCKSVHYHAFKWINKPDATISPVYYLAFIYSSTCFGRPHSHHQELNNCSSSLWFYCWSAVVAVLLVVVGPAGPTTTNSTATIVQLVMQTSEVLSYAKSPAPRSRKVTVSGGKKKSMEQTDRIFPFCSQRIFRASFCISSPMCLQSLE
jgi:hypothetical protein